MGDFGFTERFIHGLNMKSLEYLNVNKFWIKVIIWIPIEKLIKQ